MLDTESQWSEALTSNNIRAIIRWLQKLTDEGEDNWEQILLTFSCWVQRTSEFAKKELLTLCFSRCQGLWMFLDRSSFARVNTLLQRLYNLLSLAQWVRRHLGSVHLWHGAGIPCVFCRDTFGSTYIRCDCWNREHRALKQHIWLGRLVQWWGIMGLLPKYPEPHEMKRISKMWREMVHRHQRACLDTPGWISFIQGMVTQLDKQHGFIWTSEDCTDQCYPPPNLQALLKLVLMPRIDNMSIQAILMYFILDMANFLQCKDDLLQSFCHAFTIPSSFSQQIRAFWMLDHGHIKASLELLLSPRAAVPRLSWQHSCIIRCLLMRKQSQLALRYIHCTRPTIETIEDAKLCADVLIQNSCFSEAWSLLKRGHTEGEDMVMHFLLSCNRFGLHAEALKYIPTGHHHEGLKVTGIETTGLQLSLKQKDCLAERPPCPLSAKLYQTWTENNIPPEELVKLVREAVMEMRKPQPKIRAVVWPEHTERKLNSREMFLSTQALRRLTPSPSPVDVVKEAEQTAHTDQAEEEQPVVQNQYESPEHISSSEDLNSESVSSFTLASSLPLLGQCCPHVYDSTLTLQRNPSVLADEENQSREDGEQGSRTPSSVNVLLVCPDLMVTPDGTTDPVSLSKLNKDILKEIVLSAEEGGEDVKTGGFSTEDSLSIDAVSGPSIDETLALHIRMSRSPQVCSNDVSQTLPFIYQSQVESDSFLSRDYDNRRLSFVPKQLYSYSLIDFMDSTAKQKGDNIDGKQAEKDEHTSWNSLGKASQGAIRSWRARSRRNKRVKRT